MKKAFLIILMILACLIFVFFGVLKCEINVIESPNKDYQIVSWLTDKGGFGYGGAFYIKEKGLFSKWYKLGIGPFSGEWLSETDFSITYSYYIDDDCYKEYNVNDFFDE